MLGASIRAALAELALFGLLEIDTHYRIPPVFIRAYAGAFAADYGIEVRYPDGETGPAATAAPAAREYRLKISLVGARPPIWRRILVPSDVTLADLHQLIQAAFGWDGSHPHDFRTGGRYGRNIGKDPYDDDPYADSYNLDEAEVPLDRFLVIAGDRLSYIYDFGDNWEHLIVLEAIAEPGPGRPEPFCIGGRGANALDDCGGVWGWAELVEIVNDTLAPDHQQMRRWAGLRPGEVLDPKEFNAENVNAALSGLHV
nr:plasmid pRiA4b ORF-3 family protein [Paeniglutamicibacter psychrophenolicus]